MLQNGTSEALKLAVPWVCRFKWEPFLALFEAAFFVSQASPESFTKRPSLENKRLNHAVQPFLLLKSDQVSSALRVQKKKGVGQPLSIPLW